MVSHKALVLHAFDKPLTLETVPTPSAKAGEAIVQILAVGIVPYLSEVLTGERGYPLAMPLTPGQASIGRVKEVGPDATVLKEGQLVYCDIMVRARDNPDISILHGLFSGVTPASNKLAAGEWRNGSLAEYCKFPLENVYPLNEELLIHKMGYTPADLCYIGIALVPFGGLSALGLKPSESIIVAPATGKFGGAAVSSAIAMGAVVIAAGRNKSTLDAFQKLYGGDGRLKTVVLSGDVEKDSAALVEASGDPEGADAYLDFSPSAAAKSTHLKAALAALKTGGRACIQGGIMGDFTIPYFGLIAKNIHLQGRFMYEREQIKSMIKLIENGNLKLGKNAGTVETKKFKLDDFENALRTAAENPSWGTEVVIEI